MQDFTGVNFVSSDQHKTATASRVERDNKDISIIIDFFRNNNPFSSGDKLKNIVIGQVANTKVNIHDAPLVGTEILKRLKDTKVSECTFKNTWKAINMGHKLNITSERG